MTPFQERCCRAILKAPNGCISTNALAAAVKKPRIAVVSAMRSLERAEKARSFRNGNTQWAALYWSLR